MRWPTLLALAVVATPIVLPAQTHQAPSRAAASIKPRDVARRIGIIAHDSMMGRDTPSRGLDLTAQYVADQFQSFGLRPGGDSGSWFQRYPITRRRLDLDHSLVLFESQAGTDTAGFTTTARYDGGPVPEETLRAPAILVAGPQTAESAGQLDVHDKVVLFSAPPGGDPATIQQVLRVLYLGGSKALVILSDADSIRFAGSLPGGAPERVVVGLPTGRPVSLQVRAAALIHSLAGIDLSAAAIRDTSLVRDLPGVTVTLAMRDSVTSSSSAPNTVGILEGSDPVLKNEYLVYSAHMDHIGITPGRPDSINNGADDDGSGTVGVVELAEAFSRPGARPKRSIIFLTVSGEEKGLWGSNFFTAHPPVPIRQIVADINIDMIGRNWADTIVAIGKQHSDLGSTLNRVNAAHPELRMTAIDDRWPEEQFYFRSDHYNFARRGVPILFFFNGVHDDYHQVTDSPDKINSGKEARILQLLFYLGRELGNSPRRPQWNPQSRKEIVEEESVSGK